MKSRAVSTSKITVKTLCLAQTVGEQNRGNTHFHTKGCRTIEHSFDESTCAVGFVGKRCAYRERPCPIQNKEVAREEKEGIKYMSMHAAVNWFAEVFLAQTWGHKEHQ